MLAHGLLGFDEVRPAGLRFLPSMHYWRGVKEALAKQGIKVYTVPVPPAAAIEMRAKKMMSGLEERLQEGEHVNIIA